MDDLYLIIFDPRITLQGYSVPWVLLISVVMFVIFFGFTARRKKKPWRIAASKKWIKRFRANKVHYSSKQRFAYIRKVDHFLWEEILMSCFEERGYPIVRTKMTRDGGSDGFVSIKDDFIVIQAKRYSGYISKSHVLSLEALVVNDTRLSKGIFIHTGKTSGPIMAHFNSTDKLDVISGVSNILSFLDCEPVTVFGNPLNVRK